MASILILYATPEGYTARIAGQMVSRRRPIVGHDTPRDNEWGVMARFADVFVHRLERP